ncbi:unnamed protein product [Prorocentrum cordatum]|uniref:Subtilisin n=1 Tax=Prorocentrum cordatum TaxID=2364126 RepID=A0ABN9QG88_9DINO|nr:unnamed protein product [Polarella glacialis]
MVHVLISAATFALAYAVGAEMQLMQMSLHGLDGLEAATLRTDFAADDVLIPQPGCAGPGRESGWLTVGKPYTPAPCAIGCATDNYFTIAWKDANCKCSDQCTNENGGHTSYAFVQSASAVISMVLHVNTSQQKGRRLVEAADHMVKGASWSKLVQDIDCEAGDDYSGASVSLSSDGSRVAPVAYGNDGAGSMSGHVRVFGLSGITWSQVGQDIDGEAGNDLSGWPSVSLSSDGSRVAIGAYGNDGAGSTSGHVRVFGLSGNTWSQLGQDIDGEASGDYSGWPSVSLSSDGSRVAIGAYGNDGAGSSSGHVRIFGLSGNTWSQVGQDIDGEAGDDLICYSVSLSSDGSRVAIGAYGNDGAGSMSGHVRVFGLSGNTWGQVGQDIDGEA